jgi:HSP20 family molecular chaperone IbpA
MNLQHFEREDDVTYRVVDHGDRVEHVADLGIDAANATVDVVGDTAIVVLADEQYEVVLPDPDPQAFIRNGVLTISMEETE